MKPKAVGFYWTLPVMWVRDQQSGEVGFRSLSPNIDEAVQQSRTIAYQAAVIRRYAKDNGFDLVHESAFIEPHPDRTDRAIKGDLARAERICRKHDATLLYVDFSHVRLTRRHTAMEDAIQGMDVVKEEITADEDEVLWINGAPFNPYTHFNDWRERQRRWIADKPRRIAHALERAGELRAAGMAGPTIAKMLNAEGIYSSTGKDWTSESLRKFLNAAANV